MSYSITLDPSVLILSLTIWTIAALLIWLVVRFTHLPSLLKYHLSAAAILALPAGLIWAVFFGMPVFWGSVSGPALNPVFFGPVYELPALVVGPDTVVSGGSAGSSFSIVTWISVGLLGLIAAGWLRLLVIYLNLKRALWKTSRVHDSRITGEADRLCRQFGITRNIRMYSSAQTQVPFTTGMFRPVIVLPESLLSKVESNENSNELRMILAHELVHIRRNDYPVHLMELVIRHTFWMHPLVHMLYRQSGYWREVACDSEVVEHCREEAGHYAQLLFTYALCSDGNPAFRAAMAEEHHLLRRIREIEQQTKKPQKELTMKKSFAAGLGMLLLIGGLMACSDLTKNTDRQTDASESETVIYNGEEISVKDLRSTINQQLDGVRRNLTVMDDEQRASPEVTKSLKDHERTLENLLIMLDNGHFERVAESLASVAPSPPAPPVPPHDVDGDIRQQAEKMPEMIGGMRALYEQLEYPEIARRAGIEGRVILSFVVDTEGNVVDPKVVRSGGGGGLDEAALDAMSRMKFEPAEQNGEYVSVQMFQPVVFRLGTPETE